MKRTTRHDPRSSMLPDLMHAIEVPRPFQTRGWIYEGKVGRWRMLAVKDDGRVKLISRNGRDHTKRFRDLVAAPKPSSREARWPGHPPR